MPVVDGLKLLHTLGWGGPGSPREDGGPLADLSALTDPGAVAGRSAAGRGPGDLRRALEDRRAYRRWADREVAEPLLSSILARGLAGVGTGSAIRDLVPVQVMLLVRHPHDTIAVNRWEPALDRLSTIPGAALSAAELLGAVNQVEFAIAPVVVSLWGDLASACRTGGGQGYAQALFRSGLLAEGLWIEAVRSGLCGSIFAGLRAAEVPSLVRAAGPGFVPLLSLALGHREPHLPPSTQ